ncbi:MAG: transposase [Bacteroidaceae bacterium]|nr:transposase [Bacteroidaceae bacterium]
MSKERLKRQPFSMDFKFRLLKEYYESGLSMYSISKKHGVNSVTFLRWVKSIESQSLSLPEELSELENQIYMKRKKPIERNTSPEMTELERLRDENLRLRKALSYSELRNEALHEVLKIGRDRYGIDLLKKAGAKQ